MRLPTRSVGAWGRTRFAWGDERVIQALALKDLAVCQGGRELFCGLTLELKAGQACALTGANGAGKTTLLRAVAGLVPLEAGEVAFGGLDPVIARGAELHFLSHTDALKPPRTAREELIFWALWCGGGQSSAQASAKTLGLTDLLDLEIRRLSSGQRRRLALARILAAPRPLWLLDEPLGPLDGEWRARFGEQMRLHLDSGGLILAAVHDPLPVATVSLEIGL